MASVRAKVPTFLHAVGHAGVNQSVQNAHVMTGLFRNSIMYRLHNGEASNMGPVPADKRAQNKKREPVTQPETDTVRVGLNLEYAPFVERRFGTIAKSLDQLRSQIALLGEKVFKL